MGLYLAQVEGRKVEASGELVDLVTPATWEGV